MNTINKYHPARSVFGDIEKWFEPFQARFDLEKNDLFATDWTPAVDIKDEKDKFIIHADLPGVKAKDIDVSLEKGILTIKGEREAEKKTEKENYVHTERSKGTFMRRFSLPDTVDAENIEANSQDGILEVVLHKTAESGARKINVGEK